MRISIAWFSGWLALGLSVAGAQAGEDAPGRPALTVSAVRPRQLQMPRLLAVNGSVAAWQEASICSDVSGLRILRINAQVGDNVKQGQVLALLDDERLVAEVDQAAAAVAEAEANLADAEANAVRARAVAGSGAFSEQQVNQYLTAAKTARARLQSAKASLAAAQLRLKHTRLIANDDGVVSANRAILGAAPAEGQELFRLIRQWRLEWRGEVTGDELLRLHPGMPVTVRAAGAPDVAGKIRALAPALDAQSRNALVYADLPNAYPAGLRPGMFARGEILLGEQSAWAAPAEALALRDGFSYVYRLEQRQGDLARVRQIKVEVVSISGDLAELRGVGADDELVAAGGGFLVDGDWVRVVEK